MLQNYEKILKKCFLEIFSQPPLGREILVTTSIQSSFHDPLTITSTEKIFPHEDLKRTFQNFLWSWTLLVVRVSEHCSKYEGLLVPDTYVASIAEGDNRMFTSFWSEVNNTGPTGTRFRLHDDDILRFTTKI